jgi:hypothetical protein
MDFFLKVGYSLFRFGFDPLFFKVDFLGGGDPFVSVVTFEIVLKDIMRVNIRSLIPRPIMHLLLNPLTTMIRIIIRILNLMQRIIITLNNILIILLNRALYLLFKPSVSDC